MPDPIEHIDKTLRDAQEMAGKYTQPVLRRYPLLFALLLAFGAAALFTGFHLWAETVPLFHERPAILIFIGVIVLFLTGTLYKTLDKGPH
ncbi:MAG: hypothetical protein AAB500_02160 [Patescibacteria group bacterium]